MEDYIGKYVKEFESGQLGSLALSQCGQDWGLSCGSYQLTLRWGNCINFLNKYFPEESKKLYYTCKKDFPSSTWPGILYCSSPEEVKKVWMECYNKVGADKFFEYEHEYMAAIYYSNIKKRIQQYIDLDKTSRAFQECFWSWAINRGNSGAEKDFLAIIKRINLKRITHEKLFDLIYDKRYAGAGTNRYKKGYTNSEREKLRKLLKQPGIGVNRITSPSVLNISITTGGSTTMKYTDANAPLVCMMTQSTCYKGTTKMDIKGVLWHSTGAANPQLKRYVQPDDDAPDREQMLEIIGVNKYKNDLNHINRSMGMNAWIGELASGEVTAIQTMPWDFRPWGCGSGSKGSCNSGWIQFEICEPSNLNNKEYFNAVYKEACELTAYLCKKFNINPFGTTKMNGVNVPNILCHGDSHKLGLGSNHIDVLHWLPKHNKTMDDVRSDIGKLMGISNSAIQQPSAPVASELKIGDEIELVDNAVYASGKPIPNWVLKSKLYLRKIQDNGNYVFSILKIGPITGTISPSMVKTNQKQEVIGYEVKITASVLNIREKPTTQSKIIGQIKKNATCTIIETSDDKKWGKVNINSRFGWISLNYAKKI